MVRRTLLSDAYARGFVHSCRVRPRVLYANIAMVVVKDEVTEDGQCGQDPGKVEAAVSMAEVDVKEAVEKSAVAANTRAKKASRGKGKIQSNTLKAYFTSQKRTTNVELDGGGAAGGESDLKQTNTTDSSNVDSASDQTGVG